MPKEIIKKNKPISTETLEGLTNFHLNSIYDVLKEANYMKEPILYNYSALKKRMVNHIGTPKEKPWLSKGAKVKAKSFKSHPTLTFLDGMKEYIGKVGTVCERAAFINQKFPIRYLVYFKGAPRGYWWPEEALEIWKDIPDKKGKRFSFLRKT